MVIYLWPFLILTGLAMLWAAGLHLGALFGLELAGGSAALQSSLLYLWLPGMLLWSMARRRRGRTGWMAALMGCPPWLRWLVSGLSTYSVAAPMLENWLGGAPHSAAWAIPVQALGLYSLAFGLLYSLLLGQRHAQHRRNRAY